MASHAISKYTRSGVPVQLRQTPTLLSHSKCKCRCHRSRPFSSSTRQYRQQTNYKESFGTRLRKALGETKIKWYPIPVGVGIGFLGLGQLYRITEREKAKRLEEELDEEAYVKFGTSDKDGNDGRGGRPRRRERIRPTGPWLVQSLAVSPILLRMSPGKFKSCLLCH
jgi:phosphatidylserine decarboxylase